MKVNDKKLTPQLRFPEFKNSGEWEEKKLGDISTILKEKVGTNNYTLLSITAGYGLVSQLEKFGKEIAGSSYENYIVIHKNDFAYNKSATKEYQSGYVALLKTYDVAAVPNSIFLCFRIDETILNVFFLEQLFKFNFHDRYLRKLIQIGARAHGSLNISNKDFFNMPIPIPPLKEQQKIAEFLSSVDELIDNEKIKLENLREYKKGLLQNLFPKENQKVPDLRFPEFKNSGEWEEDKLSSIINLISSNVKVQKKEYLSIGKYPIIDQSINYIAGYTNNSNAVIQINSPVIVFGDHTCILKYIDFNFAQGADGIKILSISKLYPRFVYYAILNANIQPDGYKRHFSILKNIPIKYPVSSKEQQKIADFLSSVDELIIEQIKKIKLLQEYKKGLLQQVLSVR